MRDIDIKCIGCSANIARGDQILIKKLNFASSQVHKPHTILQLQLQLLKFLCYIITIFMASLIAVSPPPPTTPSPTATTATTTATTPPVNVDKLLIHFCPTGSAPILKKTKFALPATDPNLPFSHLHKFLRKQLKLEPENALFLYVNSAFGPGMNERLVDLRACFGNAKGELIVNYCLEEAWG